MYKKERVSTGRILLMRPQCQGAKALSPMRLHAPWPVEEIRNKCPQKREKAMPPWLNGDSEGATARCVSGTVPYYAVGTMVWAWK